MVDKIVLFLQHNTVMLTGGFMEYDVIVIGAGNAGLTAAATLAKKGVKTLLIEKHNIPGGCATSFCRGRFEFEVSLHQLSGMGTPERPGPLRSILDSVGVLDTLEFVQMDKLYRMVVPGLVDITLPANKEGIVNELQAKFPEEKDAIKKFFDFVWQFFMEVIGAFYLNDPDINQKKYPLYYKYALKDTQSVLNEYFTNPILKAVITPYWTYMGLPPSKLCFSDMAALLFSYAEFKPYHIKGGSQMLSNCLLETFYRNGGEALFNTEVQKLLVKNNSIYGVKTSDGAEFQSKYVLSNASAISTFVDMLDDDNVSGQVIEPYKGSSVGTSFFTIYCGLDCEYDKIGINEETNFICNTANPEYDYELSKVVDTDQSSFIVTCYNVFDNAMVPEGTSQVVLVTMKYADAWLKVPPAQYYDEKHRCAEAMLKNAEKVFPGLVSHIEEMEIATPITHMRYLNHPGGGAYGFDQYVKDSTLFISPKPPINGLYCAGSWYGSAGYQPTLTSGHSAAMAIVKDIRNK